MSSPGASPTTSMIEAKEKGKPQVEIVTVPLSVRSIWKPRAGLAPPKEILKKAPVLKLGGKERTGCPEALSWGHVAGSSVFQGELNKALTTMQLAR